MYPPLQLCFLTNTNVLLCNLDVAARGLDVDDIRMVVNFDFPNDTETCELLIVFD